MLENVFNCSKMPDGKNAWQFILHFYNLYFSNLYYSNLYFSNLHYSNLYYSEMYFYKLYSAIESPQRGALLDFH